MEFSWWQTALSLTEIAGANDRTNEQEDNHNSTSDSNTFRVAFKLLAKSMPAPRFAQCRRNIDKGYCKRDQE
jgi:hypothetical protein